MEGGREGGGRGGGQLYWETEYNAIETFGHCQHFV